MAACKCGENGKNFNQPNCVGEIFLTSKLAFVYRNADDGTRNGIDISDDLNDTYFDTWINQTEDKRFFLTGEIVNVVDERGDSNVEEIQGVSYFVSEANRTLTFEITDGASPELKAAYESLRCKDLMVYHVTETSQLVGDGRDSSKLYGFKVERNTMDIKYMRRTKESLAKLMISFTLSNTVQDSDIAYIDYNDSESGAGILSCDLLDKSGLIDTNIGAASSITTTGFVTEITYDYGQQFNKQPVKGLVPADFILEEISPTPGTVVISSATENPDGTYSFVFPAETSGDVLRLTGSKDGLSFSNTIDITIP